MKNILLFIALFFYCSLGRGQIITTVAGDGTGGYSGDDSSALSAGIGHAGAITFDRFGNYFITEINNTIRKISPSGIITTVAGNDTTGFSGDGGLAIHAEFNFAGGEGLACDSVGNLYIADAGNNRIRKIDAATGVITSIAGTGVAGFSGDGGMADTAEFNSTGRLTFDSIGNLYVTDQFNYRIRKIDTSGIITTIAGNGVAASTGDSGLAVDAEVDAGTGIFWKNNNLYICDGPQIRVINLSTGYIYNFAGNGIYTFSGDGGMADTAGMSLIIDVTADDFGNVYISDFENNRIRKVNSEGIITTVAGNGLEGYYGDGGLADSAELYSPRGIAVDACGNLFIVDNGNGRIRKVTFSTLDTAAITITASPGDTVCSGAAVTFTAASSSDTLATTYLWLVNGSAVTDTNSTYTYIPANGDSISCVISIAGNCNTYVSNAIHIFIATPSVSITVSADTVCAGTEVTYTAIDSTSSSPAYTWYVNGFASSTAGATYTYTPANGDVVTCRLVDVACSSADTAISNTIHMVVNPPTTPVILITSTSGDTVCSGITVIYTSETLSGGTAPAYQWSVNSTTAATTPTLSYSPANGDTITCLLTSNASCTSPGTALSNSIIMDVEPAGTSTISISGPGSAIIDSPVTLSASITGAGSTYIIVWYNNGTTFDTTTTPSVTYTKDTGTDNISAKLIPSSSCITSSATPQPITVDAKSEGISNISPRSINIYPNPAHNEITITGNNITNITISNTIGQTLITQNTQSGKTTIGIPMLPAGIYLLTVTGNEGQKTISKFVKQ